MIEEIVGPEDGQEYHRIITDIRQRGYLTPDDSVQFNTTVDVLNAFFGKNYKQGFASFGKSWFVFGPKRDHFLWCVAIGKEHKDWLNTFLPLDDILREAWLKGGGKPASDCWRERAVFAKDQTPYQGNNVFRFKGIYKFTDYEDAGKNIRLYKLISQQLPFAQWPKDIHFTD